MTERRIVWGELNRLFPDSAPTIVVSGLASGPDTFGLWWAVHHGIRVDEHEALWATEGRSAGYKRNVRMAKVADALAAFYDGVSRGTRHMIDIAREHDLEIRIIRKDR